MSTLVIPGSIQVLKEDVQLERQMRASSPQFGWSRLKEMSIGSGRDVVRRPGPYRTKSAEHMAHMGTSPVSPFAMGLINRYRDLAPFNCSQRRVAVYCLEEVLPRGVDFRSQDCLDSFLGKNPYLTRRPEKGSGSRVALDLVYSLRFIKPLSYHLSGFWEIASLDHWVLSEIVAHVLKPRLHP